MKSFVVFSSSDLTSDDESLNMSANASSLMFEPSFLACFRSFWKYF